MDIKFNVNNYVKVKLTEKGISILQNQHNRLNEEIKRNGGTGIGVFTLEVDEDGYTKFQLHKLMNKLGHAASVGSKPPFETEFVLIDSETE